MASAQRAGVPFTGSHPAAGVLLAPTAARRRLPADAGRGLRRYTGAQRAQVGCGTLGLLVIAASLLRW